MTHPRETLAARPRCIPRRHPFDLDLFLMGHFRASFFFFAPFGGDAVDVSLPRISSDDDETA